MEIRILKYFHICGKNRTIIAMPDRGGNYLELV